MVFINPFRVPAKSFRWKMASSLLLASAADFLFYGQSLIGWTLGFFTLLVLLAFLLHNHLILKKCGSLLLVALTLGLCAAQAYNPTGHTVLLALLAMAGLALQREPWPGEALLWLRNAMFYLLFNWTRPIRDGLSWLSILQKRPTKLRFSPHWIMPVSFSGVFIFLFSLANPVIQHWLAQIQWSVLIDFLSPPRSLFFTCIFLLGWSFIKPQVLRMSRIPVTKKPPIAENSLFRLWFSPQSVRNSLLVFNLVFLAQSVLDGLYLWGHCALPDGLTYAQYAHNGVYPLMATALLAGGFVLLALKPGSDTERHPGIQQLVTLWILQNVFLTVSSLQRTLLYIDIYSLTHLRAAAMIWIGLVALGLVWMLLRIAGRKSNRWLININAATLLVVLYACGFVDFNEVIATYNVRHCQEVLGLSADAPRATLDLEYFADALGASAIPALDWYQQHAQPQHTLSVQAAFQLRRNLAHRVETRMQTENWRGWTYKQAMLHRYLMQSQRETARAASADTTFNTPSITAPKLAMAGRETP